MDNQQQSKICSEIYQRFPEVSGCHPEVHPQGKSQYLMVFKGTATAPDGKKIPRIVRVVVNQDGSISKITTSR